jgi:hypothetical protein
MAAMSIRFVYLSVFLCCSLLVYWGCRRIENNMSATVDFNYHIRPILVQKCYLCHGPDAGSRKANLRLDTYEGATALLKSGNRAIDIKHTEKSMMLFRINHKDPEMIMPTPDSKWILTKKEKKQLEKWIHQGADWKPHWAFIAPEAQNISGKSKHPIDYFIDKELENQGLSPVEEASKNSLIRRVSFLLTGLPPSPAEVQSFLVDSSPDAYAKMVDKYLDSPHFGERWARHWMDLVRFAETKGHEFDYAIPGAWRYRDYLIRAFNADVPYQQLIKEHLAGDLLPQPRINKKEKINESQLGTLFFAFPEGTHSPVDIRKDEADRIDNLIDVTGKSFLGLTVSCAKCHDHKFDPISTKDYYALYGVMEGTRFTPASPYIYETKKRFERLKGVHDSIKNLVLMNRIDQFSRNDGLSTTDAVLGNFTGPDLNHWKSDGLAFTNETTLGDPLFNKNGILIGFSQGMASSKRLAKGVFGALRSPDFVIDKNYIGVFASGNKATIRIIIDNFQLISYPIYGGLTKQVDNEKMDKYLFDVSRWKGHKAYVEILPGIFENHIFNMPKNAFVEVKYVISFNDKWIEPPIFSPKWNARKSPDIKKIKAYLDSKEYYQAGFPDSTEFISSITEGFGKNSHVFIRGNHKDLSKEKVTRSFLSAVSTGKYNLNVSGSGRLALAEAISDKDNPLTYRVFVNRVWHHLFGKGIVETVDNFGLQGKLPSHPALLDYLALSFVNEGYSLKKLIRKIVLSETFKRTTKGKKSAEKKDPYNHYLSYYPLRRLDAESLRDAMLSVSENMNPTLFGESVPVHITPFMNGRGKPRTSGPMDGAGRRSIYVEVRRNFLDPFMSAFDRPIPFSTFGKRTVTNVPAQALILMNDPFVHHQAGVMAKTMNEKGISGFTERMNWIYQRAFSRNPSEEELNSARALYESLKKKLQGMDKKLTEELCWKEVVHTHFNLKEFIYLL